MQQETRIHALWKGGASKNNEVEEVAMRVRTRTNKPVGVKLPQQQKSGDSNEKQCNVFSGGYGGCGRVVRYQHDAECG
jgi:hypothetical protein